MRKISAISALLLSLLSARVSAAASDQDVYVRNPTGYGVQGAMVAAIRFSTSGPDSQLSQISAADADGFARLSLVPGYDYEIFASSQGFLPSIRDQFNNPEHIHVFPVAGVSLSTPTVTISSFGAPGSGEVVVTLQAGTPNSLISGDIRPANDSTQDALAFGLARADSVGVATVTISNIPYFPADSCKVGFFDPGLNKGVGRTVDQPISAGNPRVVYQDAQALSFANAMAPIRAESRAVQNSGSNSNLSVDGVVVDTQPAANSVPWVGISLSYRRNDQYCPPPCVENRWVNADDNGRFQLYGLQSDTTYYVTTYSGCRWDGTCFQGAPSTFTAYEAAYGSAYSTAAPLGSNDFFYGSTSTVITKQLRLPQAPGGSAKLAVYVKDQAGNPIPQSFVNLWPDHTSWETSGACIGNQRVSNPGLATANQSATTGYALLTGLPSGNYRLNIWTQFSQNQGTDFNAGPDGQSVWDWSQSCGSDDLRLTIASDTLKANIYNSSGTALLVDLSTVTVTVAVPTSASGLIKGTLTFPYGGINLSNDPINITVSPKCENGSCQGSGGYYTLSAPSTGPVVNYSINVSSGYSYYINVTSSYWGLVREGGGSSDINLQSTGTVILNMKFAPAGRVQGKLYKPDGSLFQPTNGMNNVQVSINANGQNSWGWSQVAQDGSYNIGGLLPGDFNLQVRSWTSGSGSFDYSDPYPRPSVSVVSGIDTYKDINLIQGVAVRINVTTASLPAMSIIECPGTNSKGDCPPENWMVKALPKGTVLDTDKLSSFLLMGGDSPQDEFRFAPSTAAATANRTCQRDNIGKAGFCVNRLPSPSTFDMLLMRRGNFDQEGLAGGVRPYFTILLSTQNIVINDNNLSNYYWGGSSLSVKTVDLTPSPALTGSGVALEGTVSGQNLFRQQDYDSLGGNFDNFMKYIPMITVYDSTGNLKAAGAVVPKPTCFAQNITVGGETITVDAAMNRAIAMANSAGWTLFNSLFNSGVCSGANSWGFDIRGLPAGENMTAVLTTPNYPPYQAQLSLGVNGSTTTLNLNLDQLVGSGATLSGVVYSTNGAVLANASISIESGNYKKRTFITDSNGRYSASGLPAGTYKIAAQASGYTLAAKSVDVSGTAAFTADFVLRLGGSSITGTVYAQKVPYVKVQPDAQIFAYDDDLNRSNPTGDLPLYKAVTSSSGFYRIDGLETGKLYKIFLKVPGKYVLNQTTRTVDGAVSGIDFTMLAKPLDIEVFGRPAGANYEFTIVNPKDFSTGRMWIGYSPYALAASTEVTSRMEQMPDNQMLIRYPVSQLSPTQDHVLHIEATSLSGKQVTKDLIFGANRQGNALQSIDDALIGDETKDAQGRKSNDAVLDYSGLNASALTIPAGAMLPISSAAVPTMSFKQQDVAASTQAAVLSNSAAFASGVYQIQIASASLTDRGFDVTLAYDKNNADISDIAVHHFDEATQKWAAVPGLQTIDPVKGTVTVRRIKSLASVLGLQAGSPLKAQWTAQGYAPQSIYHALAAGDSGSFAVLKPSLVGNAYSGTVVKIFNFPNPFSLSAKTPTLANAGTSITTNGTVIRFQLPPNVSGGRGHIRIYTAAGELVRDLDLGDSITGGSYYYTQWDGKNKKGVEVANGVYYGTLSVPGVKIKDATFKMAVIK